MSLDQLSAITIAVLGVVAAVLDTYRRRAPSPRELLVQDLDILSKLSDPKHAQEMHKVVTADLKRLTAEHTARRDPTGTVLGLAFLTIGGAMARLILNNQGWWWLATPVALLALLFGVYGTIESLLKVERNSRGRAVREEKEPSAATSQRR